MKTHTISNQYLELTTLDYGATIVQLYVKDKDANPINVVLGYKDLESYRHNTPYMGASVGRYAGRIHPKGFTLDNQHFSLFAQDQAHLHGGKEGFSFKIWKLQEVTQGKNPQITYTYRSEDMEEGYPGNLEVQCTYALIENRLEITYKAITDKDTVVNLTNHNYYNLNGKGSILDHQLCVHASNILEKDDNAIPTGQFTCVKDTHYDFTSNILLQTQLEIDGIDDSFVLDQKTPLAKLYSPNTGIEMKISTNQPAVIIYTPKTLDDQLITNSPISTYPAICFETQNLPDAPNHTNFPSAILKKGDQYINHSKFEFNIR